MYELIQVSENDYYFQCPAKIGLVRVSGDEVVLIDSGNDKDAGKKVLKLLNSRGWRLRAIYNTHSHADHIGGNRYLQDQTGCAIYAPAIESGFTNHPLLEPAFLFGACPPSDLRHKFLMAKESASSPLNDGALPDGMTAIPLPGHSFGMVGYRTQEGTVYLADCLSSQDTLEKYQISFLVDVKAYLETLEAVKVMDGGAFVPSHADASPRIADLAQRNIDKVREIADQIIRLCAEPRTFESILQALFTQYGLTMTFEQFALVGSTVRSYLAWLKDTGYLQAIFEDNLLLWVNHVE